MLKKFNLLFILFLIVLNSCNEHKSYYNQFDKDKPFVERISDINKSLSEIRKAEKGKRIKEDVNLLKYEYEIGKSDTYVVTYLFDKKGCFEIGIDGYFEFEKDAVDVVKGIISAMNTSTYTVVQNEKFLYRWTDKLNSISIELDYKNTDRGLFVVTIFANN